MFRSICRRKFQGVPIVCTERRGVERLALPIGHSIQPDCHDAIAEFREQVETRAVPFERKGSCLEVKDRRQNVGTSEHRHDPIIEPFGVDLYEVDRAYAVLREKRLDSQCGERKFLDVRAKVAADTRYRRTIE
jgi:hypothetical protein